MQQSENPKPKFPRAQESIAPGNVDLTARMLSVEGDSTEMLYRVIVEKVHGYGMASRPIAEGAEIIVSLEKLNMGTDSVLTRNIKKKGGLFRMTVHAENLIRDKQTNQVWQIRNIK